MSRLHQPPQRGGGQFCIWSPTLEAQQNTNMKIKFAILTLLSSILFFTGCSTVGNAPDLARVKTSAKLAAYIGSSEYMRANPVSRPGFALAVEALKEIETAPTVDLTMLLSVVNRLPTKDIRSERVQMLITSTTILLSDFGGQLPLERMAELRPVATAIREGVELALK
jgi:hypothetical protein